MKLDFNIIYFPLLPLLAFAAPLPLQAYAGQPHSRTQFLMGTLCTITAYGADSPAAIGHAFDEIRRLESVFSIYRSESELSRINNRASQASVSLSRDMEILLTLALKIAQESRRYFDPTHPSGEKSRGWDKLEIDPRNHALSLPKGARIDLGGIAKGYAMDAAAATLKNHGVSSALINFGGQILALSPPPGEKGWPVLLTPPDCRSCSAGALQLILNNASLSTSGLYERPGHIRDPQSGQRLHRAGTTSVILPSATAADGWSTALFVAKRRTKFSSFSGCIIHYAQAANSGERFDLTPNCPTLTNNEKELL